MENDHKSSKLKNKLIVSSLLTILAFGICVSLFIQSILKRTLEGEGGISDAVIKDVVSRFTTFSLGFIIIATVLSIFVVFGLAKYLTRSINRLHEITTEVEKGNFDAKIDPWLKESEDEVGELARAFDRMLVEVNQTYKTLEERVRARTADLKSLNEHLEDKVHEQTKEIKRAYEVEKKAVCELKELDKAKTTFILATQHHLRTPLTIINVVLRTFMERKKGDVYSEADIVFVEKAGKAVGVLGGLINEFLEISQMNVGKSILNRQPTSIYKIIQEILGEASLCIERKQLTVEIDFTDEAKIKTLPLDRKRFQSAILNLIDNAIKYTPNGGNIFIRGELVVHSIERTERYRLTIKDTGIGMTEEEKKKMFTQLFDRGITAEKLNVTGQGIGLVFTKHIIEAHGGTITAESDGRDKGAWFVVEMPAGEEQA